MGVAGILVLEVPPGTPAQAAGLRPTHRDIFGDIILGDMIVGLDGKQVRPAPDGAGGGRGGVKGGTTRWVN